MKKYPKRLLTLSLALLVLFSFASCKDNSTPPDDPAIPIPPPNNSGEGNTNTDSTQNFTYKTDMTPYLAYITSEDLTLINKDKPCGASFTPPSLVDIPQNMTQKSIKLNSTALEALKAMFAEMRADGIDDIFVTSAYRSYEYQTTLFNTYMENERKKHPTYSDEQIRELVLSYSAYPGQSEHHSGLCVDLMTSKMSALVNYGSETPNNPYDLGFAETEAFTWLQENAHKFGFILRYPEDKQTTTGYSYESWHYRFVGRTAATAIHSQNITLEEYISGNK